ncbi:MAG: kynureninase [Deltaproteobacteria bacterium]|nr:kynureninase [Deltaproteobacteria bacterium]
MDRAACERLDRADPLRALRAQFELPEGIVYLDGNSLGALPKATARRVGDAIRGEWGRGLIRSWNDAGWIDLARRVGDDLAQLLGAGRGQVVVGDSTSVNLYKVLSVAADLQCKDRPSARVLLSERSNFPTDLYIAESVAAQRGLELLLVEHDALLAALGPHVAAVLWTHVNYRTGRMLPMAEVNRAAHAHGAAVVWDLAHSAGAVPLALTGAADIDADADFAVGCGYKYLNGGPGAPGFAWVHPRHLRRLEAEGGRQPLSGWMGHAAPFAFEPGYRPADGIQRFATGTPPVLALRALECGVATLAAAGPAGGMAAVRAKSVALTDLFIRLVEDRCGGCGLTCITPRRPEERGSQVSLVHPHAFPVMQALIARGIVGDFRADPDGAAGSGILRFGFTPLYTQFADVWAAAEQLAEVLSTEAWRDPRYAQRGAVT